MRPRQKDARDEIEAALSFFFIATLALGALVGVGIARIFGWGQCP